MTAGLWGTRRPTRISLGRQTPSGKGARRRGLSLGRRDGAPCAGDCRRLAEQARSASPPSAARCPSLSAGSPTTASRASDPRKAQQAASSTPTAPHRHTHREHRPPPDHCGGSYTSSTGPYTSRERVGCSNGPDAPLLLEEDRGQAQQREIHSLHPVQPRPLISKVRKAALSERVVPPDTPLLGHALVPKAPPPRSLASWPQAKHVPSPAATQRRARSRRSDREVQQEMPASAFIRTRAVERAVEAQRNHSFSGEGGETLQIRNTC